MSFRRMLSSTASRTLPENHSHVIVKGLPCLYFVVLRYAARRWCPSTHTHFLPSFTTSGGSSSPFVLIPLTSFCTCSLSSVPCQQQRGSNNSARAFPRPDAHLF